MKKMMILLALVSAVSLPVMAGEACCGAKKAEKTAATNTCAVACQADKKSTCTDACKDGCLCAKIAAEKAAAEKSAAEKAAK